MSDDGLLGRVELERAFSALGDRLVRRGVVADLFIVGGAAMALAYDANRVTRDVDATFIPHGVVLEEARNVADAMGLPRTNNEWPFESTPLIADPGQTLAGTRPSPARRPRTPS